MPKLIIFIFLNLLLHKFSLADNHNYPCKWENKFNSPCLEINSLIPNSSKLSKSGINKITITRKEIEESGAIDLIDILKSIPDINITQSGPKGQQASLFMRGTGSNHTLVMINGVPINDQSTTQGLHDFGVDFIQTIQQIEIYPGSSGTHFGSNAIGGAINIILTGDYKDHFSFLSDNNFNYELLGNKTFIYEESSLNVKIGSVKNETVSARGNISDEKDKLINYSTNINYEKFLKDHTRIYNNSYIRQTKAEYDNSNTNQTGYEGDNKMASIQFGLENQIDTKTDNYIIFYNIYDRTYNERGTIDKYESQAFGLKYNSSKILNDKFSYGTGYEYKYDWGYFDNNGTYEASTNGHSDNLAVYSNFGWKVFDNLKTSFFGRTDNHKQTGINNSYKLNFEQNFSNLNLGISYMNGFRNPTLYEMFGTDNYGYSGNQNLKPEKNKTYEIYSDITFNTYLKLSLKAFKANIQDNIEYIDNQYQNDTDNTDLNQTGFNNQLDFKIQDTRIKFFSSFLSSKKEDGADQLRRPKKNYGFNLNKKFNNNFLGNFKFHLNHNHYGKHFDTHSTNFKTIKMDSTDIIDLKISKKLFNTNFYIKISNVMNEIYQRPHGYNHEGRNLKFGIKY